MAEVMAARKPAPVGLGTPGARWAVLIVWFVVCTTDAIGEPAPGVLQFLSYALTGVGTIALTRPGAEILSPLWSWMVIICAIASAASTMYGSASFIDNGMLNFSSYLIGLIFPRGNIAAGAIGGGAMIAVMTALGILMGATPDVVVTMLAIPIASIFAGVIWYIAVSRIVAKERAHRSVAAQRELAVQVSAEAASQINAEVSQMLDQVRPIVAAISSGAELDEALHRKIAITEAEIRDRLRSPALRHPVLAAAVRQLRQRGISVLLLGEQDDASHVISTSLATQIASRIQTSDFDSLTIRTIPRGRYGAVSLHFRNHSSTTRILLDSDGEVIEQG